MHFRFDDRDETSNVSTGRLPPSVQVRQLLAEAYDLFRTNDEGQNADYIPALAAVPRTCFGICVAGTNGALYEIGDVGIEFSIQSVSKPFVFALVLQVLGEQEARLKLGVNSSGLPFNSVMAIELNESRTTNPMVNAGAIAATSLVPGNNPSEKWEFIQNGLSRFAGRRLTVDMVIYQSESATNHRNQGIARLLESYGRIYYDPLATVDIYTRQCSLNVTARDLAVMGATLADGGMNPITREQVIDPVCCKRVLAVMATAGLYEYSGDWLYEIGLPGKSGVSGGIVTVSPGKGTPGRAQLYIDGQLVGQADFSHTTPFSLGLTGGITVGADPGAPVAPFYEAPFEFTGTVHSVTFDVSGDVIADSEVEMRMIMARQ